MSIEATNPSGQTVVFDEDVHTFTLQDSGLKLKGVTSFLSSFFGKFDSKYWSERKANERKITAEEILAEWAAKAKKGRDEGHNVHSYAEYIIMAQYLGVKTEEPKPLSKRCSLLFECTRDAIEWLAETYTPTEVEKIVFSKKLGIAGIIDCLAENDENVCIIDWKQNKEIKSFNPYQNGLGPISHLQDHDFNKYSLQLNSYRRIMIEENYFPGIQPENFRMMLMHLTPDGFFPMNVKPMDEEMDAMLAQSNSLFPTF